MFGKRLSALLLIFILCLTLLAPAAMAEDTVITRILSTSSTDPVAGMPVSQPVITTGTEGCAVASSGWSAEDGTALTGNFPKGKCVLTVTLTAKDGYLFAPDASGFLFNAAADTTISVDGKTAVLKRTIEPHLYAPTVVHQPTNESADEGDFVSFAASAIYHESCSWRFLSPDGKEKLTCEELLQRFPGIRLDPDGGGRMNVYKLVPELDGWKVFCVFTGPGGSSESNRALITVRGVEPPAEAVTPPEPTPEEEPSPVPSEPSEEAAAEPVHEHSFSSEWRWDDGSHWHECACGEVVDNASHSLLWTVEKEPGILTEGMQVGRCVSCDYERREVIPPVGSEEAVPMSPVAWIFIGLGVVIALLVIVKMLSPAGKHRRKK